MSERRVRTRFAPSPTGPLHMGGVRTALFAYLFAKKHGGDFLLRIEDTDRNRHVVGAEEYIIESLAWCGIHIDEGVPVGGPFAPYRQSERKESGIYLKYAQQLVDSGHAYYAFDTAEELESIRNRQQNAGNHTFQYNHAIRMEMNNSLRLDKSEVNERLESGDSFVIRLKVPENQQITFTDLIRGSVTFHSDQVDDKVLLKSDGMPTYHLAHIVDDVSMEITHAVRGEEWLPSAPAHILIYQFLGWENKMPFYAHLPLLLKPDGNGKLSKRDGDRLGFPVFPLDWTDPATGEVSSGYREKGYYPEAFVNMLALLGWNPGTEQELFTMDELIAGFSFDHVHKAGARFDPEKSKWFNEQYLRKKPVSQIATRITPWLQAAFDLDQSDRRMNQGYVERAAVLLRERVQFEQEMILKGKYLFIAPNSYDETVIAKKWKPELLPFFGTLANSFNGIEEFTGPSADVAIKLACTAHHIKPGEIMQLLRVFISGEGAGVDLLGMLDLLGRDEVVTRLQAALKQFA